MKRNPHSLLVFVGLLSVCGVSFAAKGDVSLTQISVLKGFEIPESFAIDVKNNCVYVPSCAGDPKKSWVDAGDGFISKIDHGGKKVLEKKWLASRPDAILNDPKALAIFNGYLYICDNKRLLRVPLDKSTKVEQVDLGTTGGLGDCLVYNDALYVGYGKDKVIIKLDKKGKVSRIKGVASINGLAAHNGKLYTVTWGTHDIFEIDPTGKRDPISLGLADKFVNLDGIDILKDGTFLISDFKGNAIYGLKPDRKTLKKLADVDSPADILVDHKRSLLYVPSYEKQKITVYRIDRE